MNENLNVSLSEILTKTDSFGITLLFFCYKKWIIIIICIYQPNLLQKV